ncbi:putative cytochrome P450 [Gordonia effusa NBRC 100432]|uniref:Putative cytochrome P450 n=1 Tax=Gordonia effusa NBRC 100432 TaxID=1077974 RepID=H0R6L5_9ACTN|nr:cytochrome P450 [Gordonia effusa]GAB20716.1 putative cytochrome P450 [Gordonia effusa NBRC 100432]
MLETKVDVFDQYQYLDGAPYADLATLRDESPVYRNPDPQLTEGHWAVTRHADIVAVARNSEVFSSYEKGSQPLEFDEVAMAVQRLMLINQDPPKHARVRGLVSRGFTPKTIATLKDRIDEECRRIVDQAFTETEFDFVQEIAAKLPIAIIAELMGVPESHRDQLLTWSKLIAGESDHQHNGVDGTRQAVEEMAVYAAELRADRAAHPRQDVATALTSADADGNRLSEEEFHAFFILMTVAGNETTRYALSGAIEAFDEYPDEWLRLRESPDIAKTATDEVLRWVSPTRVFRRTARVDGEIGGVVIRGGEKVVAHLTSGNRDERVFEDPDSFDIGRSPNPHVAFGGGGPHFCLGKHLALMEIESMLRELASRADRIEVTRKPRRLLSYHFNGLVDLEVRVTRS